MTWFDLPSDLPDDLDPTEIHTALKNDDVEAFRAAVAARPKAVNTPLFFEDGVDYWPSNALECVLALVYALEVTNQGDDIARVPEAYAHHRDFLDILLACPETNLFLPHSEWGVSGLGWLRNCYMSTEDFRLNAPEGYDTVWEGVNIPGATVLYTEWSVHVIRKFNEDSRYDPNEQHIESTESNTMMPYWVSVTPLGTEEDDPDEKYRNSKMLAAFLEHPFIHPSKTFAHLVADDPPEDGGPPEGYHVDEDTPTIKFTEGDEFEFLEKFRANRLWAKVRLWRFTNWWWKKAGENQHRPGGRGHKRVLAEFAAENGDEEEEEENALGQ